MKKEGLIRINFTITVGGSDRIGGGSSFHVECAENGNRFRHGSEKFERKLGREGKILPAWKTRPMCLHGLLFNLIGLLGEKLCTEPLPVEGKLFYKRTSRHRHLVRLSYLLHLLHSPESKRESTDFSLDETISNTSRCIFRW